MSERTNHMTDPAEWYYHFADTCNLDSSALSTDAFAKRLVFFHGENEPAPLSLETLCDRQNRSWKDMDITARANLLYNMLYSPENHHMYFFGDEHNVMPYEIHKTPSGYPITNEEKLEAPIVPPPKPEKPSLFKRIANKITFGRAYQLENDLYQENKWERIAAKDRYEAHGNRLLFEYGQMLSNVSPWDPHVMKAKVSELIDHDWNKSIQPALEEDAIGLEFETKKAPQKTEIKLHELNTNAKKKPENISRERPSKAMNDPTMNPKEK